jgi:putative methyltransferase (TIGR04325 family)
MTAPIVLFTYSRPTHTKRTVESLLRNPLAVVSDLIVYSDTAPTPEKQAAVDDVRLYLATITGFRSVTINCRPTNFGLARSIIEGVTEILQQSDRVIVLEDDMVTSPHFLTYMNQALDRYADDDRVASIHGYVYPVDQPLPEAFFLPGADCWGWATWRRGWQHFNPDGRYLLRELKRTKLLHAFDFNGAYAYSDMLEDQIKGLNDSWAIRWYASAFLAGKLTLYPGRSLVHNIGNDDSGTHCDKTAGFDATLSETPIDLGDLAVEPSREGLQAFEIFFRRKTSRRQRWIGKAFSGKGLKSIRTIAKNWLPPALLPWVRKISPRPGEIRYEGDFAMWEEACTRCTGYEAKDILAKVLAATLKVKRGEAAFERDSVPFDEVEHPWPVLAGLMWAAARNGGRLNVLDFGGALGSSYFQTRTFWQALPEVRWSVVEQSHYVEAGQAQIQDERLRFYYNNAECLRENQPNVILLSSVLQYLASPIAVLAELASTAADCLIIDRTPFSKGSEGKIVIQRVPPSIYCASYPMWVLSEQEIMGILDAHWHLVASNLSPEGFVKSTAGIKFSFQGMLFERRR